MVKDSYNDLYFSITFHIIFSGLAVWLLPQCMLIVLITVTTYDSRLARTCIRNIAKRICREIGKVETGKVETGKVETGKVETGEHDTVVENNFKNSIKKYFL